MATYEDVAEEYYDTSLHPTCADFRDACRIAIRKIFEERRPVGRIADLGCGKSLIAEFTQDGIVLIDSSSSMLRLNPANLERRLVDVELQGIGEGEFDWIFAVLGDPFNSQQVWNHINIALKPRGVCFFIVPSYVWASRFREHAVSERAGHAHFVTAQGASVFLPSKIYSESDQVALINRAGLGLRSVGHIRARAVERVRSAKIAKVLESDEYLLDLYEVIRD